MTSHVYITINLFNLCQHFFLPFYIYFSKCWHRLNEPYVCYAYLLITKLLKILIFAHGEHKKKNNKNVFNFILYSHSQLVAGARDPDMIATLSLSYFNVMT